MSTAKILITGATGDTGGYAIEQLLHLAPNQALRLRDDGTEQTVPLEQVAVGDRLRVRPGDKVPVDGIVLEGEFPEGTAAGIKDLAVIELTARSRLQALMDEAPPVAGRTALRRLK